MGASIKFEEVIERELVSWPDVTAGWHKFGGREFRVGRMEIGHLHGSRMADLLFSRKMRDELVARGEASPHKHLPESGWVTFLIRGEEDIPAVLALFRRNYERIRAMAQRQHAVELPEGRLESGGA